MTTGRLFACRSSWLSFLKPDKTPNPDGLKKRQMEEEDVSTISSLDSKMEELRLLKRQNNDCVSPRCGCRIIIWTLAPLRMWYDTGNIYVKEPLCSLDIELSVLNLQQCFHLESSHHQLRCCLATPKTPTLFMIISGGFKHSSLDAAHPNF